MEQPEPPVEGAPEPSASPRAATIYDVARAAQVSPSTVSRTFSRPGRVSSATARRIREVADELGYRSGEVFRAATPARSRTIALAVSDVANPVYFPIIRGAEHAAARSGFTMLLADAQESEAIEREILARTLPLVDGLVITSSRISDTDLRTLAKTLPVVVVNRHVAGLPSVVPDTARGIRRAVEHLAVLGHSRIGYLAGPEASWADGVRWRAVREACLELGLTDLRLGPFAPTVAGGMTASDLVAERGVEAVIAYNDLIAMGLMRGLPRHGLLVPRDVSVVGFDDIFAADLVTPGLTTVGAPLQALGETAVRNVVALAGGATWQRRDPVVVPTRLVVRESTGPAGGRS